ncbi:carboxypeptidase-like regulatory domain-containing protein [Flavobacterium sp.]|uniref:carboxypeptidase-like regulatory domain-containing protein n=1 Tax=Flavobacterium sp. TaxID=239 RepID=UPI002633DDA4|nr:carboxypeptidase-like regulatory domain-containing protein [Flavobacterium sp.]
MKQNLNVLLTFLICISVSAQIKGVVKDSITKQPIPFVNISVENENLGATSEENGAFKIHVSEQSKNLIFSALGFEKKKVGLAKTAEVYLKPMAYQLDEVTISKRFETREKEIGETDNQIFQAFDNGPRIDTKFFPYFPSYKKTKFIKQVIISTDSQIDDATFKIHFYSVGASGFPGEELLAKDFIVSVSKGEKRTKFSVTKFNLRMPKDGIFVGFEKLIIEKNKVEKTIINPNTQQTQTKITYYPFVLYAAIERDFTFAYSGGKWIKKTQRNADNATDKMMVYEPVIRLMLTN